MAEILDGALMERKGKMVEASRKSHGWFEYLQSSIAANRPWNELVAELITARPASPQQSGAVWFLYEKKNNAGDSCLKYWRRARWPLTLSFTSRRTRSFPFASCAAGR
jgi:hypothetical protein